jgi:hypothetical protein
MRKSAHSAEEKVPWSLRIAEGNERMFSVSDGLVVAESVEKLLSRVRVRVRREKGELKPVLSSDLIL